MAVDLRDKDRAGETIGTGRKLMNELKPKQQKDTALHLKIDIKTDSNSRMAKKDYYRDVLAVLIEHKYNLADLGVDFSGFLRSKIKSDDGNKFTLHFDGMLAVKDSVLVGVTEGEEKHEIGAQEIAQMLHSNSDYWNNRVKSLRTLSNNPTKIRYGHVVNFNENYSVEQETEDSTITLEGSVSVERKPPNPNAEKEPLKVIKRLTTIKKILGWDN